MSLQKLFLYVTSVHLLVCVVATVDGWLHWLPKKPAKIHVRTVSLTKSEPLPSPPAPAPKQEVISKVIESQPMPKKEPPVVIAKKTVPLSTPKKKIPPKKKVEKKEETVVASAHEEKKKELLKQAQEKIGKVHLEPIITSSSLSSLQLKIDTMDQERGEKYIEQISALLRSLLRLPEKGDVALHLKIERSGKVLEVKILSSVSERNQTYVKANLPKIHFPSFTEELKQEKDYIFYITLSDIK